MLNADQYNIHKYIFIASFIFAVLSLFIWVKGNGNLSELGATTALAATLFVFGLKIRQTRKPPPKDRLKLAHAKAQDLLDKIARSESGHQLTNASTGQVRIANIPGVYKYQNLLNELYGLVPACQLPQNYRGTVIDWHKYDLCIIAAEENLPFARMVKGELEKQIEGWNIYLDTGEGIGEKQEIFINRIFYASSRRCLALLSAYAVTDPRRKLELNAAMRREQVEGEACGDYLKVIPIDKNGLAYMYDDKNYLRKYAVNVKIIRDEGKLLNLILEKYIDPNTTHSKPPSPPPSKKVTVKQFAVALSFPGERRGYVKIVAEELKDRLNDEDEKVFYDKWYEAELAKPNLDIRLQTIYSEESELIVVFLCAEYEAKSWCRLEWRAVRALLSERQEKDIMPVRFDKTHIPGLFSIDGYIDAENLEPEEVADLIIERLTQNRQPQ